MEITATATSTSLYNLLVTAWHDVSIIEEKRIKQRNNSNAYWVRLFLPDTASSNVYFETLGFSATASNTECVEITTTSQEQSFDVQDIQNVSIITASWTENMNCTIV